MSLVPSLLQAILKVDGEALVMHAGEKPYVVAPAGQIELASRGLTLEAVDGIVGQLLPPELQRALDEFGAVQYELPAAPEFPREHFTVVAARGGDDLWTEIRRRRVPAEDAPGEVFPSRGAPAGAAAAVAERPVVATPPVAVDAPAVVARPVVVPPVITSPAIAASVAPPVVEPPAVVLPVAPPVVVSPAAASVVVAPPVIAPLAVPPIHAVEVIPAPVAAEPSTIADAALVAEVPSTHPQPVAYQETFAGHEAVTHYEPVAAHEPFVHHEAAALHEAVAHEAVGREPFVHHEPVVPVEAVARLELPVQHEAIRRDEAGRVDERVEQYAAAGHHQAEYHEPVDHREARAHQAVVARQESVAYQEPVREDEEFEEEEEIEDDGLSLGDFGQTEGWYEEEEEEEDEEIDGDDGLTLPDAEQLFGKRKEAGTDYEEFEVGELEAGEEYEEYEEVEEFEDGDEFELDFDTPAPSQPAMAAQVYTPAPRMFIPPPPQTPAAHAVAEVPFQAAPPLRVEAPPRSAIAEVSQPFLLVPPSIVEAPRPLAQMPPRLIAPPPEPAVFEAPQPAAYVATPVAYVPEPPPAPVVEAVAAFETPEPVAEVSSPELEGSPAYAEQPPAMVEATGTSAFESPAPVLETEPVAEMAPPVVEAVAAFETPEPVAEVPSPELEASPAYAEQPPAMVEASGTSAFESPAPVLETEPVAEMAPPAVEAVAAFETSEPVAEVAPPVVEAWAAIETPEPVAEEVPSPELEAPPSYAELPPVVAAPPPEPEFELSPPVFDETQEAAAEVPPPPVEAIAHAELPFGFVEALMPTATPFEPLAESAVEPEAEPDEEPAPAEEPSTPRPSWAARVPPATILSMSRNPIRSADFQPPAMQDPTMSGLDRLLRVSAARGASTLYLSTDAQPSVRVDGELQTIEGEPVLSARDVESLLLTLMPERSHEALRTGAATEWFCDIDVVGRVRCLSFRDHRGPGGVFRLMPTRSVSVDQLGLPRSVQALAIEPEGLVLVAGPRSSGKRTLLSAFVDQINKTRRDHVITIEREVNIVHEQSSSFVSQREVRGNDDEMLVAARAALREDPDVLVIEDLRTAALMNVALEAASAGRLVVAGFSAHTAAGAIDRIIDLYPPENRGQVQMALADCLRGVIVQVLLRNTSGGRVPAREVLLNTAAVSSVIAEGKTSQLSMAIEGGRRYGMMPINDGLVGLVQSGVVDAREAYRRSNDRPGFLAALKRHSIDTSFVERLA
jgi:twitching motility protein PilT